MKTPGSWIALILLVAPAGFAAQASRGVDASSSSLQVAASTAPASSSSLADLAKTNQLIADLKSADPHARSRAAGQLGMMGSKAKAALPALAETLPNREAAAAIRKIDPTYVIAAPALNRLLRIAKTPPERKRVRTGWITSCQDQARALDALAELGPAAHAAVPELVKLTHRLCIHEHVSEALDQIGKPDKEQIVVIAGGLQDKDPEAREAAIEYLANEDPTPATLKALGRAMNDSSSGVRLAALEALENIHPEGEGRLPLLAGFLKDPSPEIRERALFMVSRLDPEASAAVPFLHEALKDSDVLAALESAKILAKINPQDEPLTGALIGFMKDKASPGAAQAAALLESLNIHNARIDAALEPYRQQEALGQRLNKVLSGASPEELAENARTLRIEALHVASGIIQDEPIHSAKRFPSDVGRLYCWTEVAISSPPAAIVYRWYRNGRLQHEEYSEVRSASSRLWSSAAVRSGAWKVEVLPANASEPLATAIFTVSHPR